MQSGAKGATCIDVGHGQLHYKLRTDPRVTNFEKTNIRSLKPEEVQEAHFLSWSWTYPSYPCKKVLSSAWNFVESKGILVALVKPQFECRKQEADQTRGIIRDEKIRRRVVREIIDFAQNELPMSELVENAEASPAGTDGNREFFSCLEKNPPMKKRGGLLGQNLKRFQDLVTTSLGPS